MGSNTQLAKTALGLGVISALAFAVELPNAIIVTLIASAIIVDVALSVIAKRASGLGQEFFSRMNPVDSVLIAISLVTNAAVIALAGPKGAIALLGVVLLGMLTSRSPLPSFRTSRLTATLRVGVMATLATASGLLPIYLTNKATAFVVQRLNGIAVKV